MTRFVLVLVLTISLTVVAQIKPAERNGPDCSGGYPTNMSQAQLKNAGLLEYADIDFTETQTVRLASEKTGSNRWHQVYLVTFFKRSGGTVEAIAIHDASSEECSLSDIEVFVVSRHLK
jgi:hypothetical protein